MALEVARRGFKLNKYTNQYQGYPSTPLGLYMRIKRGMEGYFDPCAIRNQASEISAVFFISFIIPPPPANGTRPPDAFF